MSHYLTLILCFHQHIIKLSYFEKLKNILFNFYIFFSNIQSNIQYLSNIINSGKTMALFSFYFFIMTSNEQILQLTAVLTKVLNRLESLELKTNAISNNFRQLSDQIDQERRDRLFLSLERGRLLQNNADNVSPSKTEKTAAQTAKKSTEKSTKKESSAPKDEPKAESKAKSVKTQESDAQKKTVQPSKPSNTVSAVNKTVNNSTNNNSSSKKETVSAAMPKKESVNNESSKIVQKHQVETKNFVPRVNIPMARASLHSQIPTIKPNSYSQVPAAKPNIHPQIQRIIHDISMDGNSDDYQFDE